LCKKIPILVCAVLVLGTAGSTSADLVAWWPFDEGDGTSATDAVGGIVGELRNDVSWADGVSGSAIDTAGGNDYFYASVSTIPVNDFTLAFWFMSDAAGQSKRIGHYAYDNSKGLDMRWFDGKVGWDDEGIGKVQMAGANTYANNTWHHLVYTRSGTVLTLYVNGEEELQNPSAGTDTLNLFLQLSGRWLSRDWIDAKYDEAAIWDTALPLGEFGDPAGSSIRGVYSNGVIPEPATILLLGLGGLALLRKRR